MDWRMNVSVAALTIFVIAVSLFDLRERRIPNFLVLPAALAGLMINLTWLGWGGFLLGLRGIGLAFLLLFIPYLVGGLKAGDVKFLMAIGAFTGATDVVRVLLATLLCYPLLAAIEIIKERKIGITWLRFRRAFWSFTGFFMPGLKLYAIGLDALDDKEISSVRTPYGVAIACGTLIAIYTNFLR